MSVIKFPLDTDQLRSLEQYQESESWHPLTCTKSHILIPTHRGFWCSECPDYFQDWCLDWMIDWSWVDYNEI